MAEIEADGMWLAGQVELGPNWIHGPSCPPRTAYLQDDQLRIVTAGQIGQHKGIDILIEAAGRLRARGYAYFSVDIYGKVTDPYYPSLLIKLDLEDYFKLQCSRSRSELI